MRENRKAPELVECYIQWTKNVPRPLAKALGRHQKELAELQRIITSGEADRNEALAKLDKERAANKKLRSRCGALLELVITLGYRLKIAQFDAGK